MARPMVTKDDESDIEFMLTVNIFVLYVHQFTFIADWIFV